MRPRWLAIIELSRTGAGARRSGSGGVCARVQSTLVAGPFAGPAAVLAAGNANVALPGNPVVGVCSLCAMASLIAW